MRYRSASSPDLEDLLLHHELGTSELILDELRRKLVEKFRFPTVRLMRLPHFFDVRHWLSSRLKCRQMCAGIRINEIPIIRPGEYWRRTTEVG